MINKNKLQKLKTLKIIAYTVASYVLLNNIINSIYTYIDYIRAINNELINTYQLKSLDGLFGKVYTLCVHYGVLYLESELGLDNQAIVKLLCILKTPVAMYYVAYTTVVFGNLKYSKYYCSVHYTVHSLLVSLVYRAVLGKFIQAKFYDPCSGNSRTGIQRGQVLFDMTRS